MMTPFPRRPLLALAMAAALAATTGPALAQAKKYDTGASDTEIKLGTSMPLSGPVSSFGVIARGIDAYFKRVNEAGGINGRKVTIFSYDDEYSPPKAVEVTRRLVEQDEVLAIFGVLGTGVNTAVQKYLNAKKVPQLFIGTGATKWNDPKANPWTVPFVTSYGAESRFFAQQILKTRPNARIAVLYQNDDMGKDMLRGLKAGLGDKAGMLVAEQSYETSDPTVDSQMLALKASGADVFVNFSTGRFAPQAVRKAFDSGWKPAQQYLPLIANYLTVTYQPAGFEKSVGVMSTDEGPLAGTLGQRPRHAGLPRADEEVPAERGRRQPALCLCLHAVGHHGACAEAGWQRPDAGQHPEARDEPEVPLRDHAAGHRVRQQCRQLRALCRLPDRALQRQGDRAGGRAGEGQVSAGLHAAPAAATMFCDRTHDLRRLR